MTGISIMIIIGALVFIASIVFKVAPVYVDDGSIKSIVASFDSKSDFRGKSKRQVMEAFEKRMKINNVSLDDESVYLGKEGKDFVLIVEYEPRGNLVGSLDYIVSFQHEARFPAN